MQVFIPYKDILDIVKVMYPDHRRYNKQIIECHQIIKTNTGLSEAWRNHPAVLMYKNNIDWLTLYTKCFETYKQYMVSKNDDFLQLFKKYNDEANKICPNFITDDLCDQHKRRLYTKNPNIYSCFEEYGISFENWYVVNNELIKYYNGKKFKSIV